MTENKGKKLSIYLPLIIAIALVFGILIGIAINKHPQLSGGGLILYPKSDKLNNVIKYIQEEYVDTVSNEKITDEAIVAVLKGLDPHSVYIPAKELQTMNEPLEGNFSGIGVQFNMQNDTVIIINTIANGPSALIGIMAGDRIIKVNDTVVAGVKMESEKIVKRLKGPSGTKVKVTIKRPGNNRELVYDITRDKIPLYSVDVAYMADSVTGYVKISQFSRTTNNEFISAIEKLKALGMKKVIIDLRGNGGGYLDAAINLSDQFLDNDKLIVYTKGRAKPREDFKATSAGICPNDSVAVLIDEFTASASEIFAGAIQDNDRGIIIGRRSFGKGLVQEQTPLSDGSAIRLTVARYYTPSGRCIQKSYKNGTDDYYKDLNYRYVHGEFENKDSIRFNDSLKFRTPKGKIVYGGGGIMPDIFVPYDTTGFSKFYFDVRDLGLMYKFAFNYSDMNRSKLNFFKTPEKLLNFLAKEKLFEKFIEYARKQGLKPQKSEIAISKKLIYTQIEAYVARNFLDNDGYYPIIKDVDNTLEKALQVMSGKNIAN